jgi:hypothetical protein
MRLKKIDKILLIFLVILLLVLAQNVYADLTGTEGFAIDLSSVGAGTDFTIAFDPTEITGGTTWDDGGDASVIWTWNLTAGDPSITFGNGVVNVNSGTLQQGGAAVYYSGGTDVVHEDGGLEADVSGYSGLLAVSGGSTSEVDAKSELESQIADVADFAEADGDVYTGDHDFGGADLELPQGQTPDTDGDIDLDFTDGKLVIQHGSAHAELAGSTDVVMGSLITSWGGTIIAPDGVNDVFTVKAINSIQFPHGVVITAIYLGISSDTGYVLTVQNFDDFDTINAGNPTIDIVTYSADTTGEIIDSAPTYATIAAGQLIMLSIPATDVDWIRFEIYYYEPIA